MTIALALLATSLVIAMLFALRIDDGPASPIARLRAKKLFLSKLSAAERNRWTHEHRLTVAGASGRRYTLAPYAAFNIWTNEGAYCLRVLGRIPAYDKLLAQRLLIESDEQAFLATANRRSLVADDPRG